MKLVRFGPSGHEKPGVLSTQGRIFDCSGSFPDWTPGCFRSGGLAKLKPALEATPGLFPAIKGELRLGACVPRPGNIICIGLNYSDHAAEAGLPVPNEPIIFMKASSSFCGPFDSMLKPRGATKLDWEVELGIVIGQDCRYVHSIEQALGMVAGFTVVNDVSERAFQMERGGQWTKGKSRDHFNPVGSWLVTPDEAGDFRRLDLRLLVNGQMRQQGNTKFMIFDMPTIMQYVSQFMTLEAGDLILTGTPPGVAVGMKSPAWLQAGDVVELTISGLGTQRQAVVDDMVQ